MLRVAFADIFDQLPQRRKLCGAGFIRDVVCVHRRMVLDRIDVAVEIRPLVRMVQQLRPHELCHPPQSLSMRRIQVNDAQAIDRVEATLSQRSRDIGCDGIESRWRSTPGPLVVTVDRGANVPLTALGTRSRNESRGQQREAEQQAGSHLIRSYFRHVVSRCQTGFDGGIPWYR
jgi:hypothetical protein